MKSIFCVFISLLFLQSGLAHSVVIEKPPKKFFELLNSPPSGRFQDDIENMELLSQYRIDKSFEKLVQYLIENILPLKGKSTPPDEFQDILIRESIRAIGKITNKSSVDALIYLMHYVSEQLANNPALPEYRKLIEDLGNAAAEDERPIYTLEGYAELLEQKPKQSGTLRLPNSKVGPKPPAKSPPSGVQSGDQLWDWGSKRISEIRNYLESRIIGQPEVIESLVNLERSKFLFGISKPAVRVLMGLPGNGKDTTAENYVDAINGKVGAHSEHMFRMPVVRKESDLWKVLGSATGYIGSGNFPSLLKFLVEHSGGRYVLKEVKSPGDKTTYAIEENPEWIVGGRKSLPDMDGPEHAVIFLNEFHNWSKEMKDIFIKQALEKGIFEVNNPNGGLTHIEVPVTFVIATNEGINLLAPRELNGQRYGETLSFEKLMENWTLNHKNHRALKNAMQATNGGVNTRGSRDEPGISEELLNRLHDEHLILLRPLSPEALKRITEMRLAELAGKISQASHLLGPLTVEWSKELVDFIQSYHYEPEENARPIETRVEAITEIPLLKAIHEGLIPRAPNGQSLKVSIETLNEGPSVLIVTSNRTREVLRLPIAITEQDREKPKIEDEKIDQILATGSSMQEKVFGVDKIIAQLTQDTLLSEEDRRAQDLTSKVPKGAAKSYMFLGMSSTGKTETAKRLAEARYGNKSALKLMDFSQVQSVRDLKEKVLGTRDLQGNPVHSDFMKEYDRTNGQMLVVLDEVANAPRDVLKALYDVLREPIVTTFSDGIARPMNGVTLIMTGNAGEDWFNQVPKDIPEVQQLAAMEIIHEEVQKNRQMRRAMLERHFSSAMINRVGENNIYVFGPLSFQAIRQLTQLNLVESIKKLKESKGKRGWNVGFTDKNQILHLIEGIENAGFVLREQGASIDRFVKQSFENGLRNLLLREKIPSGKRIAIEVLEKGDQLRSQKKDGLIRRDLKLALHIEGYEKPLVLEIKGKEDQESLKIRDEDQLLTAFHEAGHDLVRKAYFSDKTKSTRISIIPGVTPRGDEWVSYAGIAIYNFEESMVYTPELISRQIAVYVAGFIAQTLVTKGARHDAGKSDDMKRATRLALDSVLRLGLSEKFGVSAAPEGLSPEQYLSTLSASQRDVVNQEVDRLIQEGIALAEHALLANYSSSFIPLGLQLAQLGDMQVEALEAFYSKHPVIGEKHSDFRKRYDKAKITGQTKESPGILDRVQSWASQFWSSPKSSSDKALEIMKTSRDAEILDSISRPQATADIQALVQSRKTNQIQDIKLSSDLVVYSDLFSQAAPDKVSQNEFGRQGGNPISNLGAAARCEGALK